MLCSTEAKLIFLVAYDENTISEQEMLSKATN